MPRNVINEDDLAAEIAQMLPNYSEDVARSIIEALVERIKVNLINGNQITLRNVLTCRISLSGRLDSPDAPLPPVEESLFVQMTASRPFVDEICQNVELERLPMAKKLPLISSTEDTVLKLRDVLNPNGGLHLSGSDLLFDPADNDIYVMNADGTGVTQLTTHRAHDHSADWSPDGSKIIFTSFRDSSSNGEIYVMNADGSGQNNLTRRNANDLSPCWSSDGTKIAFHSLRSGRHEVYVMNADGSGQTQLTNTGGGQADWQHIPPVIDVKIDIKPGESPNSINPRSSGRIAIALLTTESFDAATAADPNTIHFGAVGTEAAPVHVALDDADMDGDIDLMLHFSTKETGIKCGDAAAALTGETFAGRKIRGTDAINTVGCK